MEKLPKRITWQVDPFGEITCREVNVVKVYQAMEEAVKEADRIAGEKYADYKRLPGEGPSEILAKEDQYAEGLLEDWGFTAVGLNPSEISEALHRARLPFVWWDTRPGYYVTLAQFRVKALRALLCLVMSWAENIQKEIRAAEKAAAN